MDPVEKKTENPHRHPWEISRTRSLLKIIAGDPPGFRYADIGSGDQFFTERLADRSAYPVYAVEPSLQKPAAREKIVQCSGMEQIPKAGVDRLFLLDVLEHVKDEAALLIPALEALKGTGTLVITVPAHQFLFSEHDVFLKHFRRYNRKQLETVVRQYNLEILECFYFYSVLFVARFLQVILRRLGFPGRAQEGIGNWRFPEGHPLTVILAKTLDADFIVNRLAARLGFSFPGLSLCLVCGVNPTAGSAAGTTSTSNRLSR